MNKIFGTKICKSTCLTMALVLLCGVSSIGTAYPASSVEEKLENQQTYEINSTELNVLGEDIVSAYTNNLDTLKKNGKIDDQLCEIMEKVGNNEPIPVSIWISSIDFEEVEKRVESKVGLSKEIIEQRSKELNYNELNKAQMEQFDLDVQTYVAEQRDIAKEMLVESNDEFVDTFLSDVEDVYTYEVFPIINCSITKERILYLASLNNVESISSNAI